MDLFGIKRRRRELAHLRVLSERLADCVRRSPAGGGRFIWARALSSELLGCMLEDAGIEFTRVDPIGAPEVDHMKAYNPERSHEG